MSTPHNQVFQASQDASAKTAPTTTKTAPAKIDKPVLNVVPPPGHVPPKVAIGITVSPKSLTIVYPTGGLLHHLQKKVDRPLFWEGYTHDQPVRELPNSISGMFKRLDEKGLIEINVFDSRNPFYDRNYTTNTSELLWDSILEEIPQERI
ncbi:unnamed protein product [Penicillium bialowiezense]